MFKINDNYLKLPGSYLFSTIGRKVAAFKEANMKYEITSTDVTVTYVYNIAKTNIKIGDVIKTINNIR